MRGVRVPVAVGVVAALVVVLGGGLWLWSWLTSEPLEDALGQLPESVQRASFTDWAAVEAAVPGDDVDPESTEDEFAAFLDATFTEDLSTVSALTSVFPALASAFGITPLDAEWEIYGQAPDGAVNVLKLEDDVDLDALEERFAELGWQPPEDGPGTDGVWIGTPELVVGLDKPLEPLQENLAVVRSARLLLTSDEPAYVEETIDVVKGDDPSVRTADGVRELVASAGEAPLAAVLWVGDFACEDLAMAQADLEDVTEGEQLVDDVGGVRPLAGLVMARRSADEVRVGMVYESDEQAGEDVQARADLASGPAPGQGGTFAERFTVQSATAEGRRITMVLEPQQERLLGDLGQGPVLFLTC